VDPGPAPGASSEFCVFADPKHPTIEEILACSAQEWWRQAIPGVIVFFINHIIWYCFIVPMLLLLAAWVLERVGRWLSRHSKRCSSKKHWWQRLWCHVVHVLSWVSRIIAVLALLAIIVALIYCIISIVGLIVAA
jgi:hypothetical protein